MQPGLDGGNREAQGGGRVFVRELLHITKRDHDAVLLGEPADGSLEGCSHFSGDRRILELPRPVWHAVDMPALVVEEWEQRLQRNLGARALGPRALVGGVGGDPVEPTRECRVALEGGDFLNDGQ